jgi:hypothetical protein
MMGIAIPYMYFLEKPEEGPNVLFHGTSNSIEIQGIEAGTTKNRVPAARGGGTGTGGQAIIKWRRCRLCQVPSR